MLIVRLYIWIYFFRLKKYGTKGVVRFFLAKLLCPYSKALHQGFECKGPSFVVQYHLLSKPYLHFATALFLRKRPPMIFTGQPRVTMFHSVIPRGHYFKLNDKGRGNQRVVIKN